jgi:hypothetical protein
MFNYHNNMVAHWIYHEAWNGYRRLDLVYDIALWERRISFAITFIKIHNVSLMFFFLSFIPELWWAAAVLTFFPFFWTIK